MQHPDIEFAQPQFTHLFSSLSPILWSAQLYAEANLHHTSYVSLCAQHGPCPQKILCGYELTVTSLACLDGETEWERKSCPHGRGYKWRPRKNPSFGNHAKRRTSGYIYDTMTCLGELIMTEDMSWKDVSIHSRGCVWYRPSLGRGCPCTSQGSSQRMVFCSVLYTSTDSITLAFHS